MIDQRAITRLYTSDTRGSDKSTFSLIEMGSNRIEQPKMTLYVDLETAIPVLFIETIIEIQKVSHLRPSCV